VVFVTISRGGQGAGVNPVKHVEHMQEVRPVEYPRNERGKSAPQAQEPRSFLKGGMIVWSPHYQHVLVQLKELLAVTQLAGRGAGDEPYAVMRRGSGRDFGFHR